MQLPRQAHGEIADVDHLLDFAEAFGDDLADLDRDEAAQIRLGGAQLLSEEADELAPPRRGNLAPFVERRLGAAYRPFDIRARRFHHMGDHFPGDWRSAGETALPQPAARDAEAVEDGARLLGRR